MQSPVTSYIRAINKRRPNILTCPTHERFESTFAEIDADFHALKTPDTKDWNENYAKKPSNYYVWHTFPSHIQFDLVLSQNKFGQFQLLAPMAKKMGLPLISIEHTTVMPFWDKQRLNALSNMSGDLNVFICEHQRKIWNVKGISTVVNHCVDTDIFCGGEHSNNTILTVANDYINRDYVLNFKQYKRITNGLPVLPIGNTPGLSEGKSVSEIAKIYGECRIFLNTAHLSPIPTSLLEAMASGCACISTNSCGIPEYIEHGVNGFLYNNDDEAKHYLNLLLEDRELATKLGMAARQTIIDKCKKSTFIDKYNTIFQGLLLR